MTWPSSVSSHISLPKNIGGLGLWLNSGEAVFSDAGITPATDGQTVQQWNDQSGSGKNATQSTAGRRPTFKASVFGYPAIQFDGNKALVSGSNSDFVDAGTFTAFAVFDRSAEVNANNTAGFQAVINKGDGASAANSVWEILAINASSSTPPYPLGGFDTFYGGATNNNTDCTFGGTGFSTARSQVQVTVIRNGNSSKKIWLNGILLKTGGDSGNALNAGATPLGIGGSGSSNGHVGLIGNVYEVLYYNRALSTYERMNVETYLRTKYALPGVTTANSRPMTISTFSNQSPLNFFVNNPVDIFSTADATNFVTPGGITNPVFTPLGTGGVGSSSGTAASDVAFYNNTYWVSYEFNNGSGTNPKFGIAKASALNGPWTWVADVTVLVSSVNAFVWNPRWFFDDDGTVYIIGNSQNNATLGSVMQPFIVTALNPGTFTSWSSARSFTGTSLPTDMIDFFMIPPSKSPNGMYNLWYKNQNATSTASFIEYMTSSSRESGYTVTRSGNWLNILNSATTNPEGSQLRRFSNGVWRLYYAWDGSPANQGGPTWYYKDSYDNWANWTNHNITTSPPTFGIGTGSIVHSASGPI